MSAYDLVLTAAFVGFNTFRVVTYLPTIAKLRRLRSAREHSVLTWVAWCLANVTMALKIQHETGDWLSSMVLLNMGNAVMCVVVTWHICLYQWQDAQLRAQQHPEWTEERQRRHFQAAIQRRIYFLKANGRMYRTHRLPPERLAQLKANRKLVKGARLILNTMDEEEAFRLYRQWQFGTASGSKSLPPAAAQRGKAAKAAAAPARQLANAGD